MANYSIAHVASPSDLSEFVQPIHLETVRGCHTEQELQLEMAFTQAALKDDGFSSLYLLEPDHLHIF